MNGLDGLTLIWH